MSYNGLSYNQNLECAIMDSAKTESAVTKKDRAITESHITETAITWCSCKMGHIYNGKSYNRIFHNIKVGKGYNMK